MRTLLILAVLGGIGYYTWQRQATRAPQAEAPGQFGYAEKRVKMSFPNGRELDMVMALERPTDKECADGVPGLRLPGFCDAPGIRCQMSGLNCVAAVPPRYAGMLAGQRQENAYIHLTERATGRHAIVVAWGTTAEETRSICSAMGAGDASTDVRCL